MIAPFMNNKTSLTKETNTSKLMGMSHSNAETMKCGGMMMNINHSKKDMSHTADNEEMGIHSKSYVIAEHYCTQCHEMRGRDLYSKEEWRPIIARMKVYMKKFDKLQPDEYETIMIEHYFGTDGLK